MHKISESPMNTGFLRLYIYTFRYFEKEKQKINSLKLSGFQCGKLVSIKSKTALNNL